MVSLSVVPLVGSGASGVVSGEADSEVLAVDRASAEAGVLEVCDFDSVEVDEAHVSEVDKACTPVGL